MKTSKIIFTSLISAIALIILMAFVKMAVKSHNTAVLKVTKLSLPSFRVMNIDNCNFSLIQGDSSYIETSFQKDFVPTSFNYTLKGDTLVISGISQPNTNDPSTKIFSSDSLKSLIMKNSNINIKTLESAKISLDMDNSQVWINQDNVKIPSFRSLEILAKNHSNINATSFKIDNLKINLQKSNADLAIRASDLNGTLSDSSRVNVHISGEISLNADKTSAIFINEDGRYYK